ncbi:DUF382-domain-containing protein [Myriangium duriaei CBS 260.36]|uniref:DUF382-domain-containing protein n=1 Tax=Myriangium duriaei CBS 260.36 TaxID=1168546 RepID=A0A9P4MKB0_9PEZI|nr:DUF382-domain-containing protein [Myriangium duriaei CBS 260.36]
MSAVAVAETTAKPVKLSKNAARRAKKKAEKQTTAQAITHQESVPEQEESAAQLITNGETKHSQTEKHESTINSHIKVEEADEDVTYENYSSSNDPLFAQFKDIFAKFSEADKEDPAKKEADKPEVFYDDDNDDIPDEDEEKDTKMSKKKRKALAKLTVAELKSIVRRPELVEWTDTSAPDPRLLISIKSARNVVPVPNHWSLKREYLSSKRGIEKPHFSLPKFIADTGISEMRDAVLEKEAEKSLKQKQRDRMAPKTGKLDIDYQKLYEAFFKHQTKPELTRYGEVYYEGKEYETNMRHLRPGELSDELRQALAMPPGYPPPWLINMQRFGPPKSYPTLKVPGVNAPPPPGGSWGFEFGQWGRPPVDTYNRPLYGGDLFGTLEEQASAPEGVPVDRTLWGELQEPEEEEEEDDEEDEDEDEEEEEEEETEDKRDVRDRRDRHDASGMQSSVPTEIGGAESIAGEFTLRKDVRRSGRGTESELPAQGPPGERRQAGTVLQERNIRAKGFFGGERAYDIAGSAPVLDGRDRDRGQKRKAGDVDVEIDVDALASGEGLSRREMERRYEEGRRAESGWKGRVDRDEDLGDMVAEEGRKRLKKDQEDRERRRQGRGR